VTFYCAAQPSRHHFGSLIVKLATDAINDLLTVNTINTR